MISAIFLEGSFGLEFIYMLIGMFLAILIGIAALSTLIFYIYNTVTNKQKTSKYYWMVFFISLLIGLIGLGMVCGGLI